MTDRPARVHVHIDRLVLRGLSPGQRTQFLHALRTGLSSRFGAIDTRVEPTPRAADTGRALGEACAQRIARDAGR